MLEPAENDGRETPMEATGMTIAATIAALAFYCFVQGITPGPANLCSLATTLRYGCEQALRQWYGLTAGFYVVSLASVVMVWAVGQVASGLMGWLALIGAAYVLWLAWTMVAPHRAGHEPRAHGGLGACLAGYQCENPRRVPDGAVLLRASPE